MHTVLCFLFNNIFIIGIIRVDMKAKSLIIFHKLSDYVFLFLGPFVAAIGISLFYTPAQIASGGAAGVATVFYYLFGWNQGVVMMCINLPLILLGMKVFGFKYGIRTLIGSSLLSLWVSIITSKTGNVGFLDVAIPVNILLSAIFGGICVGSGVALTMKSGCNTGGTDIVSQVIAKYTPIGVGTIQFIFNLIVVGLAGVFLGLQALLFSIIAMYCSSQMVNFLLTGFGTKMAKAVYVISDYRIREISRRVIDELGHSGTVFEGTGMYTQKTNEMLVVIVPNHQLQKLVNIIYEEDATAFVFVNETYKVLGNGFKAIAKAVDKEEE